MEIKVLKINARSVVIEIIGNGIFNTTQSCGLYINGEFHSSLDKTINYIGGLRPKTEYTAVVKSDGRVAEMTFTTPAEFVTLNVRKFGAKGDGVTDDTVFIQAAIMACPENSRVLVTKGKYKVTSLFMKSGVNLEIAGDAEIVADNERFNHTIF